MNHRRRTTFARRPALWLGLVLAVALTASVHAYVLEDHHWPLGQPIVLNLQLGTGSLALSDGSTSWNEVGKAAMDVWNPYLQNGTQLQPDYSTFNPAQQDGKNSVFFSKTVYGDDFGDDTLAITVSFSDTTTHLATEADVLVNSKWEFNSYRGNRWYSDGVPIQDLRRVLVHEFGHVLGLDHVTQDSASIMTPTLTNYDTIQPDDILGVESIYGLPQGPPVITGSLSAAASVGSYFTYQVTAANAPLGYTAGSLPDGLSIDPVKGLISGKPTATGSYSVLLSVTNGVAEATATLLINVSAIPMVADGLVIRPELNQPFSYQIPATNNPTKFSQDFNMPPGLTLSDTGLISGVPTTPGVYNIFLGVSNSAGGSSATLVIEVTMTDPALTVVHSFNGADGNYVGPNLFQAADGNFYGTTSQGGDHDVGTVFEMTPDGVLTTLHSFNTDDGAYPNALLMGSDGVLYGATDAGGVYSKGTFFKLVPANGFFAVLHHFTIVDGQAPARTLVQGGDGSIYGALAFDGRAGYGGVVFKVTGDGTFTKLHEFTRPDGLVPTSLIAGRDGSFYGTAQSGGAGSDSNHEGGTIFRLAPDGTFAVLHSFVYESPDGCQPTSALLEASDGNFYGTTSKGGNSDRGTFFKLAPDGTLTTLRKFGFTDDLDASALIQAPDGRFYGTNVFNGVPEGGSYGTLFRLTAEGTMTVLHVFEGETGEGPVTPLVLASDGNFYGMSGYGGGSNQGVIYRKPFDPTVPDYTPPVPTLPTVSLSVTAPTVSTSGGMGVVTVSLSAAQSTDLVVHYTIRGSAINGADYVTLTGTKKFKAGKTAKAIKIKPLGDLDGASKKSVKLTLTADPAYTLGATPSAKVKILAGN